MKNLLLFSLIIFLFIIGCSEDNTWESVQQEGTIEAYSSFIENYPDDENAAKALKMIDSIDQVLWLNTKSDSTIEAFEKYISNDYKGKYIEEANMQISLLQNQIIETEDWDNAVSANTKEKYKEFIQKYPESKLIKDAEIAIQKIDLPTYKKELSEFFVNISENNYEAMLTFFSNKVHFYVSGDDYEKDDIISKKLDKETLDEYGYWNIGGDTFYQAFVNGTSGTYNENTCEIFLEEDQIKVDFTYVDNGFNGYFTLIWENINGKWKITDSQISLPSFM